MSPYDLLARQLVNELDAVVLSVEWVFFFLPFQQIAKWHIWQLFYTLYFWGDFSFWMYFPWLPPPSVPPSVWHNIVLSACLPSLISSELEVRMHQSEANRFSFRAWQGFLPSGLHARLLATSGSGCSLSVLQRSTAKMFSQQTLPCSFFLFFYFLPLWSHDCRAEMGKIKARFASWLLCWHDWQEKY